MNRVEGKAALITGGGAGIGAATGELICAEGGMALLVDADARALAGTMQAIAERVPRASRRLPPTLPTLTQPRGRWNTRCRRSADSTSS